jgi:putative spermidine/putrescine transport system substrate-binding protein
MKRFAELSIITLVAATICGAASVTNAQSLTIANNGGSFADAERAAFYKPFSESSGISVVEDNFNQELAKIRSQVDTGNILWDVVSVTSINESTACQEGLIEKIDWSEYLDPDQFKGIGGFGECGVPYVSISGGLAYDADALAEAPKTWQDFWNVEKWPGKRGLLYRAEQTLETALMADGVEPREVMTVLAGPGGVDRAFAKLEELKPSIQWWKSGAESMQLLASGEVAMIYAWNGRVAAANKADNRNFKMVFDAGHVTGSQYYAIMKGARNKDAAIEFIKFAVTPEPQANMARLINYAPTNKAAYALLTEQEKATLPGNSLDKASLQGGELYTNFWLEHGDELLQRLITFAAQQ